MAADKKKAMKPEAEEPRNQAGGPAAGSAITISRGTLVLVVAVFLLLIGLVALLAFFPGSGAKNGTQPATAQGTNSTQAPTIPYMSIGPGTLPARGNASAPVSLVEFADFQCAYCAKFYEGAESDIMRNYVDAGKVKIYFRDVPQGIHDKAMDAALAARCANEQGKFWQFHDALFGSQSEWAAIVEPSVREKFDAYANQTGMDAARFSSCYGNRTYAQDVQKDKDYATGLGITSTPKFALIIPKSRAVGFEAKFYAIRGAMLPQFFSLMRLAQDADNYVVIIDGDQPYGVFSQILGSVDY